jgi:erythromycin esterase
VLAAVDDAVDIRREALPLNRTEDFDPLLERIGDAHYVLLGEASHGTHDYYAWRAALTRRLFLEKGFSFVAVEGDWPDCYRVNRSVTLADDAPEDPVEALRGFERWPTWMWANTDVAGFVRWLRDHNAALPADRRVGFFGLDVYSLWDSLHATLDYLREHQPENLEPALDAFACFEPYAQDPQAYAMATRLVPTSCEAEVVRLLRELVANPGRDHGSTREERFDAEQNALAAAGAEAYYRAMVGGGPESWNVRDRHMVSTLERLMEFHGPDARAVVWEHNTHVGDARFTDMVTARMVNVGQLVREAHDERDVVIVGFGSHRGTVIAASSWGAATQAMTMPPARPGSTESLLHDCVGDESQALFVFDGSPSSWSRTRRDHRAVGVVYRSEAERWGNYVPTVLARRYDAFCWLDRTTALTPLAGTHADLREQEAWPTGQ